MRRALMLRLAVLILFAITLSLHAAAQPVPARNTSADAVFRETVGRFIEAEMQLYPQMATEAGDHRYDDRLGDLSRTGISLRLMHATKWKRDFEAIHPGRLSPPNEADREWLTAQADGELLSIDEIRSYERSPGMYLPTSALDSLIKRNFAPLTERIKSVTARERAALVNLDAARTNLKPERTPKVAIEITLAQMPATLGFFQRDLPKAFESVPDGPDKSAFNDANAKLIAAVQDYAKWLRETLMPRASGKFAIGASAYRRMLWDDDMVDLSIADLERAGETELARLKPQFEASAREIDPKRSPAEVAQSLNRKHPSAGELIRTVKAGLDSLRSFVIAHRLAAIPSEVRPIVAETPPFMRATTFASMDTPGPFEKTAEAYFYVTLPDPSWPQGRRDQLLEFFSPPLISDTSVHEVYPGHYVQFLNNRLNPDLVRALYSSGANAEGWALYCEQMMLDEGLHRGDPAYRLAQLQMALMRACRYLVGLRMHTKGMTIEEAQRFFEKNAYLTPHNAEVEALRGTEDPGYLRYQLGKLMILKLREDVRKKEGANFNLGKFHNAFLRHGALPIRLIRRAMLGSDGPLL